MFKYLIFLLVSLTVLNANSSNLINIGSRLELFVDNYLIDKLNIAKFKLHNPIKQPLAKKPIKKVGYTTIIKYNHLYRAYFRKKNLKYAGANHTGFPNKVYAYAESKDGKEWFFPKNNILKLSPAFSHNFSPFLDTNKKVDKKFRFKAIAGTDNNLNKKLLKYPPGKPPFISNLKEIHEHWNYPKNYKGGLYGFTSEDGIKWHKVSSKPIIPLNAEKAFDSQNVAFWSEAENCYVCYFRSWIKENINGKKRWIRTISRATSNDFIKWSKPIRMKANLKGEHLYTNQTHPYFRAPHIYISLPTRYISRNSTTDILFMSSRAKTTHYDRLFKEAFIRPGLNNSRWRNRANYVALNVVPTNFNEMSIYHNVSGHRYTLRTDGFISINTGIKKGTLLTKPFLFSGKELILNYSTSASGSLKIEIQNAKGVPLGSSISVSGDKISEVVKWKKSEMIKKLKGQAIRLKFTMTECDLYSFKFR